VLFRSFSAAWQAREDQAGLDSEGRLIDTAIAVALVEKVTGKPGNVVEYVQEPKKKNQPLAFALSDITAAASNKFGYSAEDVLNACQSLYETHKLTSYPRTDCAYLPESQHADAPRVLAAVKHVNPELAGIVDGADPRIKSKTWDDSKITAHHGIIPTMHQGNKAGLSDKERNIYDLIVRAFLAQFYPVHEFMQTTVGVQIEGETFAASGKVVTRNGWRDVYQEADEDGDTKDGDESSSQRLPAMAKGDPVTCAQATRRDAKTKPPARFTEGTLIRAMENIHKYVSDPAHKKMLREGDGIGTSATRASILSELKRRAFLETKGKQIISTTLGRSAIDALPEVVKSPVLTALYERMLKGVEQGTGTLAAFVEKQEAFIREQVAKANDGAVTIAGGKEAPAVSTLYKCMACSNGLSRRQTGGRHWWGCSNFPACKQTYPDLKGRPDYSKGRSGSAE
jgi:DNA topoisomerase-3